MSHLKHLVAASLGLMLMSSARAETPDDMMFLQTRPVLPQQEPGSVRVQASINLFVAGPAGETEEALKLRERTRRMIYEMAAHECDLLREVLAKDCRLETIASNVTRQTGAAQDGFNVNGAMSFQVTLK